MLTRSGAGPSDASCLSRYFFVGEVWRIGSRGGMFKILDLVIRHRDSFTNYGSCVNDAICAAISTPPPFATTPPSPRHILTRSCPHAGCLHRVNGLRPEAGSCLHLCSALLFRRVIGTARRSLRHRPLRPLAYHRARHTGLDGLVQARDAGRAQDHLPVSRRGISARGIQNLARHSQLELSRTGIHQALGGAAVFRFHVRRGRQLRDPSVAPVRAARGPPSTLLDGLAHGRRDLRQFFHPSLHP